MFNLTLDVQWAFSHNATLAKYVRFPLPCLNVPILISDSYFFTMEMDN